MTVSVARLYRFTAMHHLPAVGPPWNEPHWHDYTVEVKASAPAVAPGGLVIDTDRLDATWARLRPTVENLNDAYEDTSVEALAQLWLEAFRAEHPAEVVAVTVWEDDDRWGRAKA